MTSHEPGHEQAPAAREPSVDAPSAADAPAANAPPADAPSADDASATLYDKVPYDSRPYPRGHVDRLATVATLLGMTPAPIDACRVLEIGCAAGGHLIPMALTLPGSRFVGIDLSARELADGQRTVAELGLRNVELLHRGIEQVGDTLGTFDYIVCHGVFSWVPPPVRQEILAICRRSLAPQGVAYVSYNTYPGWHFRDLVRDMMFYHARRIDEPLERARAGRSFVEFLVRAVPADRSTYGAVIKREADIIARVADWYLCHDHVAEVNDPVYFHQFAAQAAAAGLQYLGEAEFGAMLPRGLSPEVLSILRQACDGDVIAEQQYLDFIRATPFRHSLLCHAEVKLDRRPRPARLERLHVAAHARTDASDEDLRSTAPVTFVGPGGTLTTNRPLMKAAMLHLASRTPHTVPFGELCAAASARVDPSPLRPAEQVRAERELLGGILLKGYLASDLIRLHVAPRAFVSVATERPVASPLARLQARKQAMVTNLHHDVVTLTELQRHVVPLLDGRRDRRALADALRGLVAKGTLVLQGADDPAQADQALSRAVETTLAEIARRALLTA